MDGALRHGEIEVKVRRSGLSVTRAELLYKAVQQWPFSIIEDALGADAASRLRPGLRTRPLRVPVHQYAADMLDYFAATRGQSVETVLAKILDDYSIEHIDELVANVASYRDSLPNLPEAKIDSALPAARRHRRP